MPTVGFVGMGKLGLPCILTLDRASKYDVVGYDVSRRPYDILAGAGDPPIEVGLTELVKGNKVRAVPDVSGVVFQTDGVVFVAVQTPHDARYGGDKPMPEERKDFEYAYLVAACRNVCQEAAKQKKPITMVVISTVLPGTMDRHIRPILNEYVTLVYSPLFIAMGTVINDYMNPEFVLIGADSEADAQPVKDVYASMHDRPLVLTSIPSAELTKVAYNTFISMKVVFGNTLMEICHKTGADCDEVHQALSMATDRVISPRYMRGGMGDGGGCHPRDLIAMAWLGKTLDLSHDLIGDLVYAREHQSDWMAGLVVEWATRLDLPAVILGKAYKPGTRLTDGSPALLIAEEIKRYVPVVAQWDPYVDGDAPSWATTKAVYVVATKHEEFADLKFAEGSLVIDPWGYMPDQPGVIVIRVGRKS